MVNFHHGRLSISEIALLNNFRNKTIHKIVLNDILCNVKKQKVSTGKGSAKERRPPPDINQESALVRLSLLAIEKFFLFLITVIFMCESFYVILNIYVYLALYMAGFRYFTQG